MQSEIIKNLLDKNSERVLARISSEEIIEVKNAISAFLDELEVSSGEEKQDLLNFRFGASQNSILHLAAKFGDVLQVEKILKIAEGNQHYYNIRNDNLFAPMHFAALNGHLAVVQSLIFAGADKNPQTSAEHRKWLPIHYAAQFCHVEIVRALIEAGVNKEIKTSFGLTPLLIGAEFGCLKVVEFLLATGAKKDVQTIDENHRMTALHYAAVDNHKDVALALLRAGIDKEKETIFGLTALEFAAKSNRAEMVAILLSFGVDKWDSALEIAKDNNSLDAVAQIKKYQKAKNNFFDIKWVKNLSYLAKEIRQFDSNNLNEMKIIFPDGVQFNAHGILSLKQQIGIFKKTAQTLLEFLNEKGTTELSEALNNLSKLVKVCS